MALIYRDYRYLDYSKRKNSNLDYFPLQSIKLHQVEKQKSGFPFNSKTLRSELFADYDIPGPGSYDSTSHSIEGKIIRYANKLYQSKEPRIILKDSNNENPIGPGEYEPNSSEKRSRMKSQDRIKLLNSKRFAYRKHKIYQKINKPNQLGQLLTGDIIKNGTKEKGERGAKRNLDSKEENELLLKQITYNHTNIDDMKDQQQQQQQLNQSFSKWKTNSEFTFDNHDQSSTNRNNSEKSNNHQQSSYVAYKESEHRNNNGKEMVSTKMLCNQLFKIKRFLHSTLINEKQNTTLLIKKLSEENALSRVGPGSYNTQSQFEQKRHPILLQNFDSSAVRRFEFLFNGNRNSVYSKNSYSTPGPGAYFKERKRLHSFQRPNTLSENKAQLKSSINTFDKTIFPGPGAYDLDSSSRKQKDLNLCFSSSQKRFTESFKVLNDSPGPADYFNLNNTLHKPQPITNKPLKNKLTKMPMLFKKRICNQSRTPIACRGDDPDRIRIFSLYNKIYNKNKMRNGNPIGIVPFGSNSTRQLINLKSRSTLGPGEYFNDSSTKDNNKHHSPEYGFPQAKQGELFEINTLTKNLSQYCKDSYFNWHKKSFNMSLV